MDDQQYITFCPEYIFSHHFLPQIMFSTERVDFYHKLKLGKDRFDFYLKRLYREAWQNCDNRLRKYSAENGLTIESLLEETKLNKATECDLKTRMFNPLKDFDEQ